jgi:peptide/nickel transport system substrate-binding protein
MSDGMKRGLALVMLGVAIALASCARKGPDYRHIVDAGVVADGGTEVSGSAADAVTLNPILVTDASSQGICDSIFNGLTRYDPQLKLEGALAERWEVKDGGLTLVFHLRHGVRWQDGQPFTSADVKFTVESIMDPKVASPAKSLFDLVSRIDTPDNYTVIAHYRKAFAPALESWGQDIIPKHLLAGKDLNTDPFNRHPVGTGPYVFQSWADKQSIVLTANPDYFEGKVHIARMVQRVIPEPSTQLLELKAGGIDGMTLQPDQYQSETSGEAFDRTNRKLRYPGLHMYTYLAFNRARPPFDDARVRWALSCAIDRDELIQGVMLGLARPCSGPYSPLMAAYDPSVKPVALDLTRSARLLDEAGWRLGKDGVRMKGGKPFAFSLITNTGNAPRNKAVLIMQQQFAKLGIKAEVRTYEFSTFISSHIDNHDFDAAVLGWSLSLDPDQYSVFHSSQTHPGENNFVSLKDAQVDRLLEQGRSTFDGPKRIAIYRALHRRIAELQPYAFLYAPDDLSALSRKFQGLLETDTGNGWYSATRWYIPKSAQKD